MPCDVIVGRGGSKHSRPRRLKYDLLRRRVLVSLRRLQIESAAERADQAQNEAKRGDGGIARRKPTDRAAKHGAGSIPKAKYRASTVSKIQSAPPSGVTRSDRSFAP